ncbi:unnamed protein product [Cladocopium goreaui]|uniref:Uncharacterized protein n=1 Tax=Cladocopium goreaui TaxID=2562237 RepID=A0A9P1FSY6_9DINO|nr:unnamed protein product [Cladocopium goreaui]
MAARALHWHRRGLIQRSRACWQQSRWSSKGKAREADALKPEKQEQSFRGRYCVEGALLPNADLEVPTDSASQSIDDRLSNRTETKMSSQRLQQEASVGPGMYAETPKDRTAGVAKTFCGCIRFAKARITWMPFSQCIAVCDALGGTLKTKMCQTPC